MKRDELLRLHEEAAPGVGHVDHEAAWERFAAAAWGCLPGLIAELDSLRQFRDAWLRPQAIFSLPPEPTVRWDRVVVMGAAAGVTMSALFGLAWLLR